MQNLRRSASASANDTIIAYSYYDSPVGPLLVAGDADQLHLISFPTSNHAREAQSDWRRDDAFFARVFEQFRAYFAGELMEFDLPLRFEGTAFQNTVWLALCRIPFGQTISYGELASRIGKPTASRAVGAANSANPLPIIVPCHRVIGSDKSLTGFGGGIEIKRFLLEHEKKILRV